MHAIVSHADVAAQLVGDALRAMARVFLDVGQDAGLVVKRGPVGRTSAGIPAAQAILPDCPEGLQVLAERLPAGCAWETAVSALAPCRTEERLEMMNAKALGHGTIRHGTSLEMLVRRKHHHDLGGPSLNRSMLEPALPRSLAPLASAAKHIDHWSTP